MENTKELSTTDRILIEQQVALQSPSTGTAYLLLLLLGLFSAHRFYLRRPGTAVLQILLYFVGIGFVWLFIDLFLINGMIRQRQNEIRAQVTAQTLGVSMPSAGITTGRGSALGRMAPSAGTPGGGPANWQKWALGLGGGIILIAAIGTAFPPKPPTPAEVAASAKALADADKKKKDDANEAAAKSVTEKKQSSLAVMGLIYARKLASSMKDPETFELKSMFVTDAGAVCYEYRATNSFGAQLAGSAVLTAKSKFFVQERGGSSFARAWNRECKDASGHEDVSVAKAMWNVN